MSASRGRIWALVAVVVLGVGLAAWYAVPEYLRSTATPTASASVVQDDLAAVTAGPHILFRSTAPGDRFGQLAAVAADDPSGARAFTGVECDLIAADAGRVSCLRSTGGFATSYEAVLLDTDWQTTDTFPLTGLPNRTRVSPGGTLVATTALVAGHCDAVGTITTQTIVHDLDTGSADDLEDYSLVVDGASVSPVDRNYWSVTFADDEDTFYATAQSVSMGHTWLVRGSVSQRTLTTVLDGGMCPSLSPDGTRLAYMVQTSTSPNLWSFAVLDLESGEQQVLDGETSNVDDQVAWLDDETILYGLPRTDEPGVTDVWSLAVTPGSRPVLLIPQAWSPQVVPGA